LRPTGCITDVGGFDAGQARIVKPHIDLMLKLHKKLKKNVQPKPMLNSDKMMQK
jgi:hypothetical protein